MITRTKKVMFATQIKNLKIKLNKLFKKYY